MRDRRRPSEESQLRIDIDQPQRLSRLNVIFAKIPALVVGMVSTLIGFGVLALVLSVAAQAAAITSIAVPSKGNSHG